VQSDFELSAIKKNLRIMSDIERVFWTVLFRMASRALEINHDLPIGFPINNIISLWLLACFGSLPRATPIS